eukprot:6181746-Pleurochrysis_carterae.AAC.1
MRSKSIAQGLPSTVQGQKPANCSEGLDASTALVFVDRSASILKQQHATPISRLTVPMVLLFAYDFATSAGGIPT